MSIPVWPDTLPQKLLIDDYSGQDPDLLISSQPDIGPAKTRMRTSCAVEPVKGTIRLSEDQLKIFRAFAKDDLRGRSRRFQWKDPTDDTKDVEMKIVSAPSWTFVKGMYLVALSLEILP